MCRCEVPLSSTVIPLRQSAVERSLKQASFDTAGVPLLAVNHSGQILAINSEAKALVGGESVVGRSVAELLGFLSHRAFARRWQRLWSQLTAEGRCEFEAKLALRSGTRLSARFVARLFRFDQDDFASISIVDTSAERAARRRARTAEVRARALAQHQSELTIVLNADRCVIFPSSALESITGEHEGDVMRSPFELILDQPSRIEFRRAVDRLLREPAGVRQPVSLHLRTRAALAGNGRSLSCVLANCLDDPRVRGLVLTARDLGPAERAQGPRSRTPLTRTRARSGSRRPSCASCTGG